jgi:hypothetical protein
MLFPTHGWNPGNDLEGPRLAQGREGAMTEDILEKRTCARFRIPGATVAFKKIGGFLKKPVYGGEFLPVLDISRGGIRFLCHEVIEHDTRIYLKIQVPGDNFPLTMTGTVRWYSPNPGMSYRFQVGVQFLPYGEKKDMNYPGSLVKIISYEQKFLDESTIIKDETGGRGGTFEI